MTPSSRSSSPWSQAQSSFYRRSPSSSASRSPGNSAMRGRGVICRRSASLVQYHRVLAAHGWPRRHSWRASASSPWPDTRWAHAIGDYLLLSFAAFGYRAVLSTTSSSKPAGAASRPRTPARSGGRAAASVGGDSRAHATPEGQGSAPRTRMSRARRVAGGFPDGD
jgi:hypothetical protein